MKAALRKIFAVPGFEDEDKARSAHLLNIILWTVILGNVVISVSLLVVDPRLTADFIISGLMLLIFVGLAMLMHRGSVRSAAILTCLVLWLAATYAAYQPEQFSTTHFTAYVVVIGIAGTLGNQTALVAATILSVLSIFIRFFLFPTLSSQISVHIASGYAVMLVALGILFALAIHTTQATIRKISHENEGQKQQNGQLLEEIKERRRLEEAYRALVERSLQGLVVFQENRIVFVNPAMAEIMGYTIEELLAVEDARALIYADDREMVSGYIEDRFAGRPSPAHYEFRIVRRDGSTRWVEIFASATTFQEKPAIQTAILDITERKQTEEGIQYQFALLQSVTDAVIATDMNFVIRSWNRTAETIYGWTAYEVIGKTVDEALKTQYTDSDPTTVVKQFMEQGHWAGEVIQFHKNGTPISIFASVALIRDSAGNPVGAVALNRDVTLSRQAERARQEAEVRFSQIFQSVPVAIWTVTLDEARILDVNSHLLQMIGYLRNEVIGHPVTDIPIWTDECDCHQLIREILEHGPIKNREMRWRTKSGEERRVITSVELVEIGGERCLLCMTLDVTERRRIEDALLESHKQVRTIVEGAPIILFAVDREGIITLLEGKGLEVLGLKPGQAIGLSVYELYSDIPELPAYFRRALDGEVVNWVGQGRGLAFDVYFVPLRAEQGGIIGVIGVATDITERINAEAAHMEVEIRASKILAATVEAVITIDDNQQIIGFNTSAKQIFGYSFAEVVGQPLDMLLPDRFTADHRQHVAYFAAGSDHARYMFERHQELSARHKDGTEFPIEASIVKLTMGGKPVLTAFVHDISYRKRMENALRESERFARSTVDALSAHIAILDETGSILAVNKAWRNFAVANSPEGQVNTYEGWNYLEVCDHAKGEGSEGAGQVAEGIRAVISGALRDFWLEYPCHSALEQRWFIVLVTRFLGNGPTRVVIAHTNITERRKAEQDRIETEQLQATLEKKRELLALKEGFISAVSHEFRTPLTVILSSAQLLELYYDKMTPAKRLDHFKRISYHIRHMVEMLDDILVISKANAGMMKFEPAPIDLEQFCQDLFEQFRHHDKGMHDMRFTKTGVFDAAVMDEKLLRHILENLLSNAIKYSPVGKRVEMTLVREDHDVVFRIRDEGIGIPPEDQMGLFEVFHRATNVKNISGTGLGLVIVKTSVETHGGTIHFESQENVGTTFTVRLPISHKEG